MATYNNKHWLLSHVRNSFISTDDTGLCEMVMLGEDFPRQLHARYKEKHNNPEENADYFCYPGFAESDDEEAHVLAQSYDLQFDMDFGHRLRSNTAQRLEKMDIAKKKAAKIKVIKWEDKDTHPLTDDEKSELFEKKCVISRKTKCTSSLLTEQLSACSDLPMNLYIQYGRVDGTAQFGVPTKTFHIFITMLPEDTRAFPLPVTVIAAASIRDFIGLICYKCSMANPTLPLKPVHYYGLYITEDDGEVDADFPSLDPREPCSKFGFKYLGLVEHMAPQRDMLMETAHHDSKTNHVSFELKMNDKDLIKSKPEIQSEDLARMRGHTTVIEAPLYRSYRLHMLTAVRTKTEVQLGISGEKVEIDPVQQKKSKLWIKYPKATSYSMDSIASCMILDTKSSSKAATFRITYSLAHLSQVHSFDVSPSQLRSSASFKYHDFETDPVTATEIVAKINNILEVHSSVSRREYLSIKDKRNSKPRRSFNLSHTLKF